MNDVRRLLAEATPLPWHIEWDEPDEDTRAAYVVDTRGRTVTAPWTYDEDAALIVHAVNNLPLYEAAVDALRVIQKAGGGECRRTDPDYGTCFAPHDYRRPHKPQEPDPPEDWCQWCIAESALRHLREEVPA